MRHKWYRIKELTDKEIKENLPIHIWGVKAGQHMASSYTGADFRCIEYKNDDCECYYVDKESVSHIMPFTSEPRKSRR